MIEMPNHVVNEIEIKGTKKQVKEIYKRLNTHHDSEPNRTYDGLIICRQKNTEEFNVGWFNEKTNMFSRRDIEEVKGLPDDWEYEYTEEYDEFPDFDKVIPYPEEYKRLDELAREHRLEHPGEEE